MLPRPTIEAFDRHLLGLSLRFEGELAESLPRLEQQNGNELWPAHVRAPVADLARRLGHGV